MHLMEAAATNCGLMIPQTAQLGRQLISTSQLATVTPDITWRYSSVIRSTSVRMMEAAAENCGRTVRQPSITTPTPVEPSPHGPSTQVCQPESPLVQATERFTAHRPNCGRKHPTRSGPTTVVAQAWPTSTLPWSMRFQPLPTHQTTWT